MHIFISIYIYNICITTLVFSLTMMYICMEKRRYYVVDASRILDKSDYITSMDMLLPDPLFTEVLTFTCLYCFRYDNIET